MNISQIRMQLQVVRRGMTKLGTLIWNILLIPSPFAPIMLFYHVAPILIVYLYTTSPGSKAGLDLIARDTGLPWWGAPAMFILCAMIGYEVRSAKVNALLTLPMAFYAVVILLESLAGATSASGLIPALYMTVSAWSALSLTRYYQELQDVKRAIVAIKQKQAQGATGGSG